MGKYTSYKKKINIKNYWTDARPVVLDALSLPPDEHGGEWAEKNLLISSKNSEPGPYRMGRTPYVEYLFKLLHNPRISSLTVVAPIQVFKTMLGLCWAGSVLENDPGPFMWVSGSEDLAKKASRIKFRDMLRNSSLCDKWREKGDGTEIKEVNGYPVYFGHPSASSLSSVNVKYMFADEVDKWPENVGGHGDGLEQLEGRGTTYEDSKILIVSSLCAEVGKPSKLIGRYLLGSKLKWHWPCPHCYEYFFPSHKMLKWDIDALNALGRSSIKKTAYLECPNCEGKIQNKDKVWMNKLGVYLAPGEGVKDGKIINRNKEAENNENASAWVHGLCAVWEKKSFGNLATKLYDVRKSMDETRLFTLLTQDFAEEYEPVTEKVVKRDVYTCISNYMKTQVPDDVFCLTGSVDVQKNQLYFVVRGWGEDLNSWLIDYGTFDGDTNQEYVWNDFDNYVKKMIYYNSEGVDFRVQPFWIDAGYRPGAVYEFVTRNTSLYFPVKGASAKQGDLASLRPVRSYQVFDAKGKNQRPLGMEITRFRINDDHYKSEVHRRVCKKGANVAKWHLPQDISEFYIQNILAEERMTGKNGKVLWKTVFRHNHYLDCEKIQVAIGDYYAIINMRDTRKRISLADKVKTL